MKIDPNEMAQIQDALSSIENWDLEVFDIWKSKAGDLKLTIRLQRINP